MAYSTFPYLDGRFGRCITYTEDDIEDEYRKLAEKKALRANVKEERDKVVEYITDNGNPRLNLYKYIVEMCNHNQKSIRTLFFLDCDVNFLKSMGFQTKIYTYGLGTYLEVKWDIQYHVRPFIRHSNNKDSTVFMYSPQVDKLKQHIKEIE